MVIDMRGLVIELRLELIYFRLEARLFVEVLLLLLLELQLGLLVLLLEIAHHLVVALHLVLKIMVHLFLSLDFIRQRFDCLFAFHQDLISICGLLLKLHVMLLDS